MTTSISHRISCALNPIAVRFPWASRIMSAAVLSPRLEPPAKKPRLETIGSQPSLSAVRPPPVSSTTPGTSTAGGSPTAVERCLKTERELPIEATKSYAHELDYRNKLVLAPMVRTGSLPMRLLSLYYGAGLVWSPEVVDRAIIGSTRHVNERTGVITYSKGQGPIFSTHPMEKPYLIFQIGSSSPELALAAAKTVEQDVSGFDLNCGCPKPFSTHAGMGAALLDTPDILLDILRKLIAEIPLPISCKIRLLPTQSATLLLVSRLVRTGIRNLTVHCRTRSMRPAEKAIWARLAELVELGHERDISVICNGDGDGWTNWDKISELTGADSVMLARAAEQNPSVFAKDGPSATIDVITQLLNITEYLEHPWGNTKFLVNQMRPADHLKGKGERREVQDAVNRSKSVVEVAKALRVELGQGGGIMTKIQQVLAPGDAVRALRPAGTSPGLPVSKSCIQAG